MTSPLERAILAHYYCSNTPYMDGSENWASAQREAVAQFVMLGLLIKTPQDDNTTKITANQEALTPYMEALAAVPLPVQRWVVP